MQFAEGNFISVRISHASYSYGSKAFKRSILEYYIILLLEVDSNSVNLPSFIFYRLVFAGQAGITEQVDMGVKFRRLLSVPDEIGHYG